MATLNQARALGTLETTGYPLSLVYRLLSAGDESQEYSLPPGGGSGRWETNGWRWGMRI